MTQPNDAPKIDAIGADEVTTNPPTTPLIPGIAALIPNAAARAWLYAAYGLYAAVIGVVMAFTAANGHDSPTWMPLSLAIGAVLFPTVAVANVPKRA